MMSEANMVMAAWVAIGVTCLVLFPVDLQLLPQWLRLRLQLFWINSYMRGFAFWLWLKLPRPRPPFRFIPMQDRPL